jgi:hypothetical protein
VAKLKELTLEKQIETGAAFVGTPDEVRAIVAHNIELYGDFEHASLQINFGSIPYEEARRSMRLFAREVMPQFTQIPAAAE